MAWLDWIAPVNTLELGGEDLIDDVKLAHIIEKNESSSVERNRSDKRRWVASLSLAGRDLTGARLFHADVRHVDFSDTILNRAWLNGAWAQEAHFEKAKLRGAALSWAQLQGASLDNAQLQGATLSISQLQGASLDNAQLQGASLDNAQLQGASLEYAQLQGASLEYAQLQGASLEYAQLQGALLYSASLQGASLAHAQLLSAFLDGAGLQGASLDAAKLQGTSFRNVFVWRTDAEAADWKDALVAGPEIGPQRRCSEPGSPPAPSEDKNKICPWTVDSYGKLKRLITGQVPENYRRQEAIERIEKRLAPDKALEGEERMAKVWTDRALAADQYKSSADEILARSSAADAYEKSIAEQWQKTGCSADGAPYAVRAILARLGSPILIRGPLHTALWIGPPSLDRHLPQTAPRCRSSPLLSLTRVVPERAAFQKPK